MFWKKKSGMTFQKDQCMHYMNMYFIFFTSADSQREVKQTLVCTYKELIIIVTYFINSPTLESWIFTYCHVNWAKLQNSAKTEEFPVFVTRHHIKMHQNARSMKA